MKGIFNNKKQNIAIGIIATITSFSIAIGLSLYNSLVVHPSEFVNIIGIEKPEISVMDWQEDYLEYFEQLSRMEGVQKTLRYNIKNITLKNGTKEISTSVRICNDYSMTRTKVLSKGKEPEYDNEIALSYSIKENWG